MQISEASDKDVSELCALVNSAYRGDTSRVGWTTEANLLDGIRINEKTLSQYFHEKDSIILKCTDEGEKILGCVYLKKENEHLYLGMLTVEPHLQNKGIGKLLLAASDEKAREMNCNSIVMTVITQRHELIDWYKRHGFFETGVKQPFPIDEKFGKQRFPLEFLILQKNLK